MGDKVKTYIGFCLRARKIVLGSGSIDLLKKGVYLVLVCSTASENTLKLAVKFKNRFKCPLIVCNVGLENTVNRAGCKVAAVRDAQLAKAICDNVCEDYELFTERS